MEAILALLGVLVLVGILISYSAVSWGFVLFKYWSWFVLPVFPELPTINFIQAMGLMLVIGLFRSVSDGNIKDEYKDSNKTWGIAIFSPWLTLAFAWIIKSIWM